MDQSNQYFATIPTYNREIDEFSHGLHIICPWIKIDRDLNGVDSKGQHGTPNSCQGGKVNHFNFQRAI